MPNTNERDALTAEDQIRAALAARPTPGPWIVFNREHPHYLGGKHVEANIYCGWDHPQVKGPLPVVATSTGIGTERGAPGINFSFIREQDAAHIAACNPKAIAALLATIDDLRAATAPNAGAPLAALPDDQIESEFKRCGGKWEGNYWMIEDADLHPYVRTVESRCAAAPAQQARAPLPLAPSETVGADLLPCPFCDGAAHITFDVMGLATNAWAKCLSCGASVYAESGGKAGAATEWNRRATTPQATLPTGNVSVGEVYTTGPFRVGDEVQHHVALYKRLPAGTLLYTRAQPQADAALKKACDLLSMTVGTLMSCRRKINYVDSSPIAKLVLEVVEFLRPWPEKMPQAKEVSDLSGDDAWYLQDTRQTIGNDVLWWAEGGRGYTTDLSKAHVFGVEEVRRQVAARGVDRAWPKTYIDRLARPAVDSQYMDNRLSIWSGE